MTSSEPDVAEGHIRSLVAVMAADGKIDDAEVQLLSQIATRMGVRIRELDLSIPTVVVPPTAEQRRALLADMKRVAMADGVIDKSEREILELLENAFDALDRSGSTGAGPVRPARPTTTRSIPSSPRRQRSIFVRLGIAIGTVALLVAFALTARYSGGDEGAVATTASSTAELAGAPSTPTTQPTMTPAPTSAPTPTPTPRPTATPTATPRPTATPAFTLPRLDLPTPSADSAVAPTATAEVVAALSFDVGECFDETQNSFGRDSFQRKPCDSPHESELFVVMSHSAPSSVAHPGDDALFDLAGSECLALFSSYVGRSYQTSIYEISMFVPTEDGWDNRNDRTIQCALNHVDGNMLTAPAAGSGR